MPSVRLTKRTVLDAPAMQTPYVLRDIDLPGFGARIMPSGYRAWVIEYRPVGSGRRAGTRRMALGNVETLSAEEARRQAKALLASVRLGADPARDRQDSRAMPTFDELAKRFLDDACLPPRFKPHTIRLYKMNLKVAGPIIGKLKVDEITKSDVQRLHRKVGSTRPTMANNSLVTISSLYKFAADEGVVPEGTNPARGVQKFKTQPKERFLTPEEFARLGDAIREFETTGLPWTLRKLEDESKAKHRPKEPDNIIVKLPEDVAAALRLLIFTGCRKMEILALKWAEVDLQRGLLNLTDTKTGRRAVVLNAPALAVLSGLTRSSAFVFPGADPKTHRGDITGYWYRARQRAGLDGADGAPPVRIHDLRHTFASFGVAGGMGLPIVGKLLGHTQASTTMRYSHLADDPVRRAANAIGSGIAAAMGEQVQESGEVVSIRGRRK